MYLITVCDFRGNEIIRFTEPEPLDFNQECRLLEDWPEGYFVDTQKVSTNPFSDSECWRDFEEEII